MPLIKGFFCLTLAVLSALGSSVTNADILRWDTAEVIPGTEDIAPGPGISFTEWNSDSHNLRFADFGGLDLSFSRFDLSWLDNAHFNWTNLRHATIVGSTLTNSDLSGADLINARLGLSNLSDANLHTPTSRMLVWVELPSQMPT